VPLRLVKYGISAGVGVVNIVAQEIDLRQGWAEPYRRVQDYVGTVGFVTGIILDGFDIVPEEGEALAISSLPLLIQSIRDAAKAYLKGGGSSPRTSHPGHWRLVPSGPAQLVGI